MEPKPDELPDRFKGFLERYLEGADPDGSGLLRPMPPEEPQTLQTLCRRVARTWRAAADDEDLRAACAAALTASAQLRPVNAADVVGDTAVDWDAIEVIDPDAAHRRLALYQDNQDAAIAAWAVTSGWKRHLAPTGADLGRMQWPPWEPDEHKAALASATLLAKTVWPDAVATLGTFGPHISIEGRVLHMGDVNAAHDWDPDGHPLAPLVAAWDHRAGPRQAVQVKHAQGIIPQPLFLETGYYVDPEKNQPSLLPVQASYGSHGQMTLNLPIVDPTKRYCLPLHIYELGAGRKEKHRNGYPPLSMRLWLEAIIAGASDRRLKLPSTDEWVRSVATVREIRDWLYPGPGRRPSGERFWPRILTAIDVLHSREAKLQYIDRAGRAMNLQAVMITHWPEKPDLDAEIVIRTLYPPGSEVGPGIWMPDLRFVATKSVVAYRMLLGLAYWWRQPGISRFPIRKGRTPEGNRYARRSDAYKPWSRKDLVRLAYPHCPAPCGAAEADQWRKAQKALRVLSEPGLPPYDQADEPMVRIENTSEGPILRPPAYLK